MEEAPTQRVRPESIAARNFSDDLDSLFGLNSGSTLGNLSYTVQEKKRNVSTQAEELAALEARIREAEERLAKAAEPSANGSSTAPQQATSGAQPSFPPRTQSSATAMNQAYQGQSAMKQPQHPSVRPPNPRDESFHPHIPGAMPMTPTPRFGPGNDYVTVDRTR